MTREEFESILEEAYIEGYNNAISDIQEDILDEEAYDLEGDYDYYTETKTHNKFLHAIDADKAMKSGRYHPIEFSDKKDNEENKQTMKAAYTSPIFDRNPMYVRRDDIGRVKNVKSMAHSNERSVKHSPYLDRTNNFIATNKLIKNIKDPKERAERIAKAKETLKRLAEKRKDYK